MSALTVFVTGTDTAVGKTHVACTLLAAARDAGIAACGYKPVASGCQRSAEGLRNEDALALQQAAATSEPYARINPYAFEPAIAPHIAAAQAGVALSTERLDAAHAELAARYELVVVEGAGGWQVPLGETQTFADWVGARGWPVLLVVGMRLGCISHALLSAESIARRTRLAGWVANRLPPPQLAPAENLATLRRLLPAPLLGELCAGATEPATAAALLAALRAQLAR